MCAVCRARPARPAALTLRSRRRGCTSCGRTLRAFKRRARQTPRVAQHARARARAARRSSAPRRRARRGLWWHLSAGRRAHTRSARAQKLEELDDAMTEARARSRRGRASAPNPETAPRAADDGRGRRRQASSRRRGAFRALRTPSLPSFPPVSVPAIPPRVASCSNRTIRAVFHRRDRGVWHRVLRGATNEDASRARGGARIPSRETNARASA